MPLTLLYVAICLLSDPYHAPACSTQLVHTKPMPVKVCKERGQALMDKTDADQSMPAVITAFFCVRTKEKGV